MAKMALMLLLGLFTLAGVVRCDDTAMSASFVFGDSLVDAGNNNWLSTLSKADIPPNGIDFAASGGQPTGRYTNGRTIADIVGVYILSLSISLLMVSNIAGDKYQDQYMNYI